LMPATSRGRAYGRTYRLNNLRDEEAVSRGRRRRQLRAACAALYYTAIHYLSHGATAEPNSATKHQTKT
jgi:hypothetical protein